jgi:hypothetical protein
MGHEDEDQLAMGGNFEGQLGGMSVSLTDEELAWVNTCEGQAMSRHNGYGKFQCYKVICMWFTSLRRLLTIGFTPSVIKSSSR